MAGGGRNEETKSGGVLVLSTHLTVTVMGTSEGQAVGGAQVPPGLTRSHELTRFHNRLSASVPHICDTGEPKSQRQVLNSHWLLSSRSKVYSRKTKPVSFYTDITYLSKL